MILAAKSYSKNVFVVLPIDTQFLSCARFRMESFVKGMTYCSSHDNTEAQA